MNNWQQDVDEFLSGNYRPPSQTSKPVSAMCETIRSICKTEKQAEKQAEKMIEEFKNFMASR